MAPYELGASLFLKCTVRATFGVLGISVGESALVSLICLSEYGEHVYELGHSWFSIQSVVLPEWQQGDLPAGRQANES